MEHELSQRLGALSAYVDRVCAADAPEAHAPDLMKFGTVLICGAVEQCVQTVILHRLSKRAHPRLLTFVKSHFRRGANLDPTAISQLLAKFDGEWSRNFDRWVAENENVKDDIFSAYGIRNSVAHGGSSSLGSKRLRELHESAKILIDAVKNATKR